MCWLTGALLYSTPTSKHDLICYNLQATGQVSSLGITTHDFEPITVISPAGDQSVAVGGCFQTGFGRGSLCELSLSDLFASFARQR